MEYLLFPKNNYYLTQGYGSNSYSHQGRKALDVSASKSGDYKIYAPFTGYVSKIYAPADRYSNAYTIWLVSKNKVMCADGKMHYVVMMLTHPVEIRNYKVGQTFNQNDFLFNDGNTGNATGKHLDIELAIYDDKSKIVSNWSRNSFGNYGLNNASDPCNYLLLRNDVNIYNDVYLNKKYSIKKIKDIKTYTKGRYQTEANLYVRFGPGKNYGAKKVKDLSVDGKKNATSKNINDIALYKKGTVFDALEIIKKSNNDIWTRTYSGYVNIVDGNNINSKRIS